MDLKEILTNYQNKSLSKIYLDKNFIAEGIDYQNYIGLKFESINENKQTGQCKIKDHYTIDGWYILWYLMANAHQSQYIKTTIDFIAMETKINSKRIKNILEHLHKIGEIYIITYTQTGKEKSLKSITYYETIEIAIGYSSKESYTQYNGYKALPIEFVKSIILTLEPTSWAIYTVLITYHSYLLLLIPQVNKDTGEIIYPYSITHYAFPKQDDIGKLIGVSDTTVKKYIDKLLKNKYKLIYMVRDYKRYQTISKDNGKTICKMENKQYGVYLLERFEYQYYNILSVPDNRDAKELDIVHKIGVKKLLGTERQYMIRQRDYIKYISGSLNKEYDIAIKNNNSTWYKDNRNKMKIEIDRFEQGHDI